MADPSALTAPAVRLYLALLLSPRPVSVAECGEWGFAELGEQLRLLYEATERGWIAEADGGPAGQLRWVDAAAAELLFERAAEADWLALLDRFGLGDWGPKTAREAAQQGELERAKLLYRALITALGHRTEPADRAAWLGLVMEALRLFRREVHWLSGDLQQIAYDQAVRLGDAAAQAVLLSTRAYEQLRGGRSGEAEAWCDRALQLSAELDDPEIRQHVLLYVANNWILMGRLAEALSMLEAFLGDIPPDLLPAPSTSQAPDTLTEASLATLANAYAWTGNDERALDLLERMVEVGTRTDQPLLAKMARVYLAWYHADHDQLELAERFSQEALGGLEPGDVYGWFAAQPAAWVAMKQGELDRARAELVRGHRRRLAIGHIHFQNSYLLDVLAWLADRGAEPIEGLTFDGELERLVDCPDQRMRGVGHRVRALQRAAGARSEAEWAAVDADLQVAIELLRSAGARPELRRALLAAAELA
ncbi:MAG: hypothetical protein JRI23_10200, partial [Deltaproteobacteria bacterium]|nr:hypothetical protein [Deltaproteobacteria bacterium]MBW2532044.1 hypothetical protein [Deltaproteobacteria bacterium]